MEFLELLNLFEYKQRVDNYYTKVYNGCYINISRHRKFFDLHINVTNYHLTSGNINIYENIVLYNTIVEKLKISQYTKMTRSMPSGGGPYVSNNVCTFSITCDDLNIFYNFLMLFDIECSRNIKIGDILDES